MPSPKTGTAVLATVRRLNAGMEIVNVGRKVVLMEIANVVPKADPMVIVGRKADRKAIVPKDAGQRVIVDPKAIVVLKVGPMVIANVRRDRRRISVVMAIVHKDLVRTSVLRKVRGRTSAAMVIARKARSQVVLNSAARHFLVVPVDSADQAQVQPQGAAVAINRSKPASLA